jgi:hypothetical protein
MDEDEELRLLKEIVRWTRETALPVARDRVERQLDSDSKKRVYAAMADGTQSVKGLETSTGANHNDIRSWQKTWEVEGIVEPGASYPKAVFTLQELGIEPAPPPKRRTRRSE